MKKIWKVLGVAALAAAVTPYKVKKDEETGEIKAKALLWNATYTPATEEHEKDIDINVGLNVPRKDAEDEAHIYTDDVTVSYAPDAGTQPAAGEPSPEAQPQETPETTGEPTATPSEDHETAAPVQEPEAPTED